MEQSEDQKESSFNEIVHTPRILSWPIVRSTQERSARHHLCT